MKTVPFLRAAALTGIALATLAPLAQAQAPAADATDRYAWLEEVSSNRVTER